MTHQQAMPPAFKWVVAGTILAAVGVVGSLAGMALSGASNGKPGSRPTEMEPLDEFAGVRVPDFRGVTQEGKPFDAAALDGRVTVLDFFFTHCPLYCPEMSTRMMEQAEALRGTDVQFLSISVDPVHDTPESMTTFAARYDADPARWTFVRAEPETLEHIASTIGFGVRANDSDQIPMPDGSTMANIIHPTSLLLVGPDRQIYGRYFYRSPEELAQLTLDARRLLEHR